LAIDNYMQDDTVGRSSAPFGQAKERSDTEQECFEKVEDDF